MKDIFEIRMFARNKDLFDTYISNLSALEELVRANIGEIKSIDLTDLASKAVYESSLIPNELVFTDYSIEAKMDAGNYISLRIDQNDPIVILTIYIKNSTNLSLQNFKNMILGLSKLFPDSEMHVDNVTLSPKLSDDLHKKYPDFRTAYFKVVGYFNWYSIYPSYQTRLKEMLNVQDQFYLTLPCFTAIQKSDKTIHVQLTDDPENYDELLNAYIELVEHYKKFLEDKDLYMKIRDGVNWKETYRDILESKGLY